jgi:hypothetical protein
LDVVSRDKFGDKEAPTNELKKGRQSSSITSSQSLFKLEVKVNIKPYQGEIDAIKLNQWWQ